MLDGFYDETEEHKSNLKSSLIAINRQLQPRILKKSIVRLFACKASTPTALKLLYSRSQGIKRNPKFY